jgi:alpha-tubulin suppressor-like RCC1 family protein
MRRKLTLGSALLLSGLSCLAGGCDDPLRPGFQPINYVGVEAGGGHSCGLALGGELYCWGRGGNGQLGDGTTARSADPVRTQGAAAVFTAVTLGQHHSCALTDDGRAHCWGWNLWGQLGVGLDTDLGYPQIVAPELTFARLSAGSTHTCGVTVDGEAWCWGNNSQGQLGTGGADHQGVPVRVAGSLPFAEISAGVHHTCGITDTGQAYCWGLNHVGQLGVGDTVNRIEPTPVASAERFVRIAAGERHSCAITAEGRARCWGSAAHGELGNGYITSGFAPDVPTVVPNPVHQIRHDGEIVFRTIAAGAAFTCGADDRGRAWCWGLGYDGQLGGNELTQHSTPRQVFATLDMTFLDVSTGHASHACGVTSALAAFCWGTSPEGAIGPATSFSAQPVRILGPR